MDQIQLRQQELLGICNEEELGCDEKVCKVQRLLMQQHSNPQPSSCQPELKPHMFPKHDENSKPVAKPYFAEEEEVMSHLTDDIDSRVDQKLQHIMENMAIT